MPEIRSYKDLRIWQKSMDLVETIYRMTDICQQESNGALFSKCGKRQYPLTSPLPVPSSPLPHASRLLALGP